MVASQWFALIDLILVIVSGVVWMIRPELGFWVILIALLPWILRSVVGSWPFQRTPFDLFIAIFLVTAWVGYWVAYDKAGAWSKVWFIVLAVLFFYALSAQPKQNLVWVSIFSFVISIGVSVYYFLTNNFSPSNNIVNWWLDIRPQTGWLPVHHGYISGVVLITMLSAFHGIWQITQGAKSRSIVLWSFFLPGLVIVLLAFIATMSRGIWLAIAGVIAIWILWKMASSNDRDNSKYKEAYPVLVLITLAVLVLVVYIGPGGPDYNPSNGIYGTNTRSELFVRGLHILADVPIIGGGLDSFPGLYSQYYLVIPFFYFQNSYNVFLDVAIEQGLIGALALLLIYIGSVWLLSKSLVTPNVEHQKFRWLSLFTLMLAIVHGLLYDYLYNGIGVVLLFYPIGLSMNGLLNSDHKQVALALPTFVSRWAASRGAKITFSAGLIVFLIFNFNHVRALWFANVGAMQMSQVELVGFPSNSWADPSIALDMETAKASLLYAFQLDPGNQTANHRLGLIAMSEQDFVPACKYLNTAFEQAPEHRGITKALGYCYVWLGDLDKAQPLLANIPESHDELENYVWWWGVHGRSDLSENAARAVSMLDTAVAQP